MPGAWEVRNQSRVLVGILHTEVVTLAWALGLRTLAIPGGILPVSGVPFDHARNIICQQALSSGATHVFFLDSDVIPPGDAILRLLARNQPIISGLYCRRSPPHGLPVCMRPLGQWVTKIDPDNEPVMEVDVVGSGCLLIRRDVLERLPPLDSGRGKSFFDWRVDMAGVLPPGRALSEDFAFCLQAREALGVKVLVDVTVQCRHVGLSEVTLGQMGPLNTHVA